MRLALACLLLWCSSASATLIPVTFEGVDESPGINALSGALFLDDSAWQIDTRSDGIQFGVLASPWQWIRGEYGGFQFNGTATLSVQDYPNRPAFDSGSDYWIIRSQLTSNVIDGLSMVGLTIGRFGSYAENTLSVIPPSVGGFWFVPVFSDGTTGSGDLTAISAVAVPEPSTLLLLGSCLLIGIARSKILGASRIL